MEMQIVGDEHADDEICSPVFPYEFIDFRFGGFLEALEDFGPQADG